MVYKMSKFKEVYNKDKPTALAALSVLGLSWAIYYGVTYKLMSSIPLEYSIPLLTGLTLLNIVIE